MRAVLAVMLAAAAVTAAAWLAYACQREREQLLVTEAEEYLRAAALACGDGS